MVRMFMAPAPTPHTKGAPGLTAWLQHQAGEHLGVGDHDHRR